MSIPRAIFRGGLWTGLAILIGLTPLWLKAIICWLNTQMTWHWSEAICENVILFFAMALVAAIGVDLLLVEKKKADLPREIEVILHTVVPFGIFTCTAASFGVFITAPADTNIQILGQIQILVFVSSVVYAWVVKFIGFLKEISG